MPLSDGRSGDLLGASFLAGIWCAFS